MEKKIVCEVSKCLQVKNVKISMEENKVIVEAGGKKTTGFACGILNLVRSHKSNLEGSSTLEKCLTHDWLTYCSTDLFRCQTFEAFNGCLQRINEALMTCSCLCGYSVTIADVVVFLAVHPFIAKWSFLQKEQYMNISRWFNFMQNNDLLCKTHSLVQFSRTLLYEGTNRMH